MKKTILSILTLLAIASGVNAQNVNIPDVNFKNYLIGNTAINTNGDTEIQVTEASAYTGIINANFSNISDATGIEAFTSLTELYLDNNTITSLDLSNNTSLVRLNCWYNSLVNLNVANGNNSNFTYFAASGNPGLTCITVDDITYSTSNWIQIDAQTSFSLNCPPCTVTIPDANFKAYLVGNTAINTNGNTEIECSEANDFTGAINCTNQNISDMTGLEAFINLDQLFCSSNGLSSIDVTSNTVLTRLDFTNNNVSTIDLSANQLIEKINGQSNLLQSLDLTTNLALEQLDIRDNPLTALDLDNNTALVDLNCRNTGISALNTGSNVNLEYLVCDQNAIISLDFSTNINLIEAFCSDNSLTSLNFANGNNSSVNFFEVIDNPNLTCITVDDVAYSTTNWTSIDAQTSFSTNCSGGGVGINEASLTSVNIYPNPVQNELFIETSELNVTEMVIIDYSGRIIKSITSQNTNNIDVSELTQGVYILKISTENGVSTNRFIKQ